MLAQEQRPGFFVYKSTNPSNRRAFLQKQTCTILKKEKMEKIFFENSSKTGFCVTVV
jgi:hypothetical protein